MVSLYVVLLNLLYLERYGANIAYIIMQRIPMIKMLGISREIALR